MQKKTIIIIICVAVLFFVLGAATSIVREIRTEGGVKCVADDPEDTFEAGWEAAKQRLLDNGFVQDFNDEVMMVEGVVTAVGKNDITVDIFPVDVLSDPDLDERVVKAAADTEINGYVLRDEAEYQAAMADYLAKLEDIDNMAPEDFPEKPGKYKLGTIGFNDIKVGAEVEILSNINIKDEKEFTASQITVRNNID